MVWLWLAVLLLSVIIGVRLDVLFSFQSNDMLTSFQVISQGLTGDEAVKNSGAHGFWMSILDLLHPGRDPCCADHA